MATDMGYGITAPDSTDRIGSSGSSEMRRLAATVVAAIAAVNDQLGDEGNLGARVKALEEYLSGISEEVIRDLINSSSLDGAVAELIPPGSETHNALREWVGGGSRRVNVVDYGTVGDGVTDDSAALQAALDAAEGRGLFIPAGRYLTNAATLRVRANTTVQGEAGTVLIAGDNANTVFNVYGNYRAEREVRIASPAGLGDTQLSTREPHAFQPGDTLRLLSQRVATSVDAGDWMLGWPAGGSGALFSEIVTVRAVPNNRTMELASGLIFPGYRPDRTMETDPAARASAVLMQLGGQGDNVTIRDLRIEARSAARGIRINRSIGSRVENVTIHRSTLGRGVQLEDCYRTHVVNTHVESDIVIHGSGDHARQNVFHIVGSQSCGFDRCTAVRGTQAYDITYSNGFPYVSAYCYVTNSASYAAQSNPLTLHPGVYAARVSDNDFTDCQTSGIGVRAHGSIIRDNFISGSMVGDEASNAGIYVYEGGGLDTLVQGNTIRNFSLGLRINDGAGKPFEGWIGAQFMDNVIQNFRRGFMRSIGWGTPEPSAPDGIVLRGNHFTSDLPGAEGIFPSFNGRGSNGLVIKDNGFRLTARDSVGVLIPTRCVDTIVQDNVFHQVGRPMAWDTEHYSSGNSLSNVWWADNVILSAVTSTLPANRAGFRVDQPSQGSGGGAVGPHTHSADDITSGVLDPARLPLVVDDSAGEKVTLGGVLVKYESGTRRLDAEIFTEEGWTNGEIHLSRSLNTVTLNCENLQRSESGSGWTTLVRLPPGFRPTATRRAWGKSFRDRNFQVWADGRVQLQSPVPDSDYVGTTFVTADAPPTTLPGAPG